MAVIIKSVDLKSCIPIAIVLVSYTLALASALGAATQNRYITSSGQNNTIPRADKPQPQPTSWALGWGSEPDEREPLSSSSSFQNSDFSQHPNFHLLPSLTECGHDAYYKKGTLSPTSTTSIAEEAPPERKRFKRYRRAVNGVPAGFGNYPWIVQLVQQNLTSEYQYSRCTGTIINRNTILTAAHCILSSQMDPDTALTHVVLGNYKNANGVFKYERERNFTNCGVGVKRTRICSTAFLAEIDDVVIHEDYAWGNLVNDVALIRLRENIQEFHPRINSSESNDIAAHMELIRPVCLPRRRDFLTDSDMYDEKKLEFAGWGFTSSYKSDKKVRPTQLMKIKMNLKPREFCSDIYGMLYKMDETKLCALARPGSDTCHGDSGGPLMAPVQINGNRKVFQVGVLAGGSLGACGRQGQPSVFSNVVEYMPWILDHLKP